MIRWQTELKQVTTLAYNPDGGLIAAGHRYGSGVELWTTDGTPVGRVAVADGVEAVAFSPDGRRLAVGDRSPAAAVYDPADGVRLAELDARAVCSTLVFAPDGSRLLALVPNAGLAAWGVPFAPDPHTGRVRPIDPFPADPVRGVGDALAVAYTPCGRRLVLARPEGVDVWDAELTGRQRRVRHPLNRGFRQLLAVSPDGRRVAFNDGRGVVVWEIDADGPPQLLPGAAEHWSVRGLGFTPDGGVVSAGNEGSVRRWDAGGGACEVWDFGLANAQSVAVAPDGLTAAAGGADGSVILWDL